MSLWYLWGLLDLVAKPWTEAGAENSDEFYPHLSFVGATWFDLASGSRWKKKKNFNTVNTSVGSQMICKGCSFLSSSQWRFTWEIVCVCGHWRTTKLRMREGGFPWGIQHLTCSVIAVTLCPSHPAFSGTGDSPVGDSETHWHQQEAVSSLVREGTQVAVLLPA